MDKEKRLEFFLKGNPIREIFGEIMGQEPIRGFAHVVQFDEKKIQSGFTTFEEYMESGPMFLPTLKLSHEFQCDKPFIGNVVYIVSQNGIMTRISANYDSSD